MPACADVSSSEFLMPILLRARAASSDAPIAEALDALMQKERVTAYIGFDCTAPSLHVGNLVQIMMLRRLQQAGHKPIVVMGGGTTKVGDPSGKDETRAVADATSRSTPTRQASSASSSAS